MNFDFKYDSHTEYISKDGYYSRCEPHEATREEALLWHRVAELEKLLDDACPVDVRVLLDRIAASDYCEVSMNAHDFARVRQYARHRVEMLDHPSSVRKGILGSYPRMVDGSPSPVRIVVRREVPQGVVRLDSLV